jgi:DNA-binding NarL/FixJ family response regulator
MTRPGFILAAESYLIRKGLGAVLNRIPGATVVREFDSSGPLIKYMRTRDRDLLLVSQSIFDQCTELFLSKSHLLDRTILLTDDPGGNRTGDVQAFIHPGESREQILLKIRSLMVASGIVDRPSMAPELSQRERTIVRLVSLGLTNKQIASKLFLSTHTVITHRKNISSKLGIRSASGLTIYAIVNNIITLEEAI